MSLVSRDPVLLTPGPLTTSLHTKSAMLRDWGSWDAAFNAVTAKVRSPTAHREAETAKAHRG